MVCRTEAGQPTGTNCDGLPLCSIGFEPIIGRIRDGVSDTGTCLCPCMKAFADTSTFEKVGHVAKE